MISYYLICAREIGELAKVWTYIAIQPKYLTIVYVRAHARAQLVYLELSPPPQEEMLGDLYRGSYRSRSLEKGWEAAGGI